MLERAEHALIQAHDRFRSGRWIDFEFGADPARTRRRTRITIRGHHRPARVALALARRDGVERIRPHHDNAAFRHFQIHDFQRLARQRMGFPVQPRGAKSLVGFRSYAGAEQVTSWHDFQTTVAPLEAGNVEKDANKAQFRSVRGVRMRVPANCTDGVRT